jgi:ribosomal protein S18 acetylase RimI-like enzyme
MSSARDVEFKPVTVRTRAGKFVKVREYNSDDFAALVEMYKTFEPKRVAQGLPPPDVPRIAHWLDQLQQKSRSLIALDGKRIVGHAIVCPISDTSAEFTIFVHQDFRELRLGTALTRLELQFAAELGFKQVYLTTELANFAAMSFYRKIGFRVTSSSGDECEMKIDIADFLSSLACAA